MAASSFSSFRPPTPTYTCSAGPSSRWPVRSRRLHSSNEPPARRPHLGSGCSGLFPLLVVRRRCQIGSANFQILRFHREFDLFGGSKSARSLFLISRQCYPLDRYRYLAHLRGCRCCSPISATKGQCGHKISMSPFWYTKR